MKLIKMLTVCVGLVAPLPLIAQGPAPAPAESAETLETSAPVAQVRANGESDEGSAPTSAGKIDPADLSAWMDGFMTYAMPRGHIPGAVVTVVQDGSVIFNKGYGFADVAARTPVDPERTLFRPGSVSKLFTWTAVMQLVEAGKLDLDADVNEYIDFKIPPYEGEPITLRNIMTHTAGFEESVRNLISSDPDAVTALGDYVRDDLPQRVFAPGTTPAYSNYATALAGYIVERASGLPFDDYIERNIFRPLGMTNASFRQPLPERLKGQIATGYSDAGRSPQPFEIVVPAPAGSLSASGGDMAKFMIAHLESGGPLLSPETTRQMHDYRADGTGPLNRMALGFYEQWVNGHRAIAHGGDTQWFHSDLVLFPDSDIGVFISLNSAGDGGSAHAIRASLLTQLADRYLPGDPDITPIDAETAREHAELMAGTYVSSRGSFTNFFSVLGLLSPTKVVVGPEGQLTVPALDGLGAGVRDWVEVEPFVWVDRNTGERLAADVKDGRVVRFSFDTISPFTVLEPAPAATNPAWLVPALIFALAIVLLAALAWPTRALVRRHYRAQFVLGGRARLAYRLSRIFSWLVLVAVAGWVGMVAAFSSDIGALSGPLDWLLTLLRIVTPVASIGLLLSAGWLLWLTFAEHRRWTMKLGAALLMLAGLILTWVTISFHLYGFGMVY